MAPTSEFDKILREIHATGARSDRAIEASRVANEKSQAAIDRCDVTLAKCQVSLDRMAEESRLSREAHANDRAVTRELIADIRASREESRIHHEAVVGALTDLAAEIRGWGGASRN